MNLLIFVLFLYIKALNGLRTIQQNELTPSASEVSNATDFESLLKEFEEKENENEEGQSQSREEILLEEVEILSSKLV